MIYDIVDKWFEIGTGGSRKKTITECGTWHQEVGCFYHILYSLFANAG